MRPHAVIHMATVTHLVHQSEDRYRINLGGTRAVFEHSATYGVRHVVFVGRHTYYGAQATLPLFHLEDEPPMGLASFPELADLVAADSTPGLCALALPVLHDQRAPHGRTRSGRRVTERSRRSSAGPASRRSWATTRSSSSCTSRRSSGADGDARRATARRLQRQRTAARAASAMIKETGRTNVPVPSPLLVAALGRFGLPKLPHGALDHI